MFSVFNKIPAKAPVKILMQQRNREESFADIAAFHYHGYSTKTLGSLKYQFISTGVGMYTYNYSDLAIFMLTDYTYSDKPQYTVNDWIMLFAKTGEKYEEHINRDLHLNYGLSPQQLINCHDDDKKSTHTMDELERLAKINSNTPIEVVRAWEEMQEMKNDLVLNMQTTLYKKQGLID